MKYFTQPEQEEMLNKFVEFDRDFTDKKYQQVIKMLDGEPNNQQKLSKTN